MPIHHDMTISKMHHTSTKAARRLTRVLRHPGSTFQPQPQGMLYCVVTITIPMRKGHFPYKTPLNSCNIYQFAANNVTSNMTMKHNTCNFDNKCCEKLWIAVYNQSATVTYMPVRHNKTISKMHHTSMKAARRLTRVLHHPGSTFQPQGMLYCVVPVTPSPDPQRSSMQINNIDTRTDINDIIAPDEYQALLCGPQ
jgi:hypothetical protein